MGKWDKASQKGGRLTSLLRCWIKIPTSGSSKYIYFRAMPTISDTKGARYNDEPIIGRTMPLLTYSHSENRIITIDIPFIATSSAELKQNTEWMRHIESAVYPNHDDMSVPYSPPPVCRIHCGELLEKGGGLCVVLEKYSLKFDPAVPVDPVTYIPYKFTMSTTWRVVYKPNNLPGQSRIILWGS